MMDVLQQAWLIPLFPLLAFLLLISLGRQQQAQGSFITIATAAGSFIVTSLLGIERLLGQADDYVWADIVWLSFGGIEFRMGFEITNLNVLMLMIVTTIHLIVTIYAQNYMKHDDRLNVFNAYVSLFTCSMLALVISINLLQMYIFWELIGVCSFLLIGFWYTKPEAIKAAKKAFMMTRIGDVAFLLAIVLLFWNVPNFALDFSSIHNVMQTGELSAELVTLVAILLFVGAAGKSAQFPLHTWLPHTMTGPLPAIALIHTVTMVAAGVFLVAKTYPIFMAAPLALEVIGYVSVVTIILGATLAIAHNDLKQILAYSTISQLGYMMLALSLGTTLGYAAGLFHLFTHAFINALLFLAVSNITTALRRSNITEIGGVGRSMKVTMWTFAVGTLALIGVFPFANFWSNKAILTGLYETQPVLYWSALLAILLTAFYMTRLFLLIFMGEQKQDDSYDKSPDMTRVLLIVLAVLTGVSSVFFLTNAPGFITWFAGEVAQGHTTWIVIVLMNAMALAGMGLGWMRYGRRTLSFNAPPILARLVKNKYGVDELYNYVIVLPIQWLGRLLQHFDRYVINGVVNLVATLVLMVGRASIRLQNGQVQGYGLVVLIGMTIWIVVMVGRRFF